MRWVKVGSTLTCLLLVALSTWRLTARYKDAVWGEKFAAYRQELAELHTKNLNEVLQKERQARERADEIEVRYHDAATEIRLIRSDNARLARELGGLRDPYATRADAATGVGKPTGAAASGTINQAASGRLSEEATRFLLDFAEDADRAAAYANVCYEWVTRERETPEVVPKPPTGIQ